MADLSKEIKKKLKNFLPPLADTAFQQGNWPSYRCSHCGTGILMENPEVPVELNESAESRNARGLDYWEPEFVSGTFVGTLHCSNPNCHDTTQVVGNYAVEEFYVEEYDGQSRDILDEALRPAFFVPHVSLFQIPADTPDIVRVPLIAAFELYFANIGGCANCVRQVAERYLDHAKVAKTRSVKGRRDTLTAHERIKILATKDKHSADILMAIKWIGNEGSHTGDVDRYDLDAGLKMIAKLLKDKFDDSDKRLERAMKEIIKRKGKRPTKRKRRKP